MIFFSYCKEKLLVLILFINNKFLVIIEMSRVYEVLRKKDKY
jgi:hypothetical protein